MKKITRLHNKHSNKPVWIAGSDPTLSSYPDDFFDNKLGVTLHLAGVKFPDATYRYFNEYDRFKFLKETQEGFMEKDHIIAMPFYDRTKEETKKLIEDSDPYCLKLTPYPPDGNPDTVDLDFTAHKVWQALTARSIEYGGHGTCLHACMYVTIMMGCNPINIIGSNHQTIQGKDHFEEMNEVDREMRPQTGPFSSHRGRRMRMGTEAIIEACSYFGIDVNWYKNYEQISNSNKNV